MKKKKKKKNEAQPMKIEKEDSLALRNKRGDAQLIGRRGQVLGLR